MTNIEKQAILRFLEENKPFHHGNCDPSKEDLAKADHHLQLIEKAKSL